MRAESSGDAPLPYRIYCRGCHADGRRCRNRKPLATIENGLAVVRDHGRVHVDMASTSCPDCGTVRSLRGGVPEELLGEVPVPPRVLGLTG